MKNKITLGLVFIAIISLSYKFLFKDSENKLEVSTQQEDFLPHQEISVEEEGIEIEFTANQGAKK